MAVQENKKIFRIVVKLTSVWVYILPIVFGALLPSLLNAQTANPKFTLLDDITIRQHGVTNILLTNSDDVVFSTEDGIILFDGTDYTVITKNNDSLYSLSNGRVKAVSADKLDNLWIATGDGILNYYNRKTGLIKKIKILLPDEKNPNGKLDILSLYIDKNNHLWIACTGKGLLIYYPESNKYNHYNLKPGKPHNWNNVPFNTGNILVADYSDSNTIWLGARDGVYRISVNSESIVHVDSLPSMVTVDGSAGVNIRCIKSINDSCLLFGIWTIGIVYYNIKTEVYKIFANNDRAVSQKIAQNNLPVSIAEYFNKKYLVSLFDTIPALLDLKTGAYTFLDDPNLKFYFPENSKIVADSRYNIWLVRGGKVFYSSSLRQIFETIAVKNIHTENNLSNNLRKIKWRQDQNKYYACVDFSDGIYVYDSNFRLLETIPPSGKRGKEELVDGIFWDKNGRTWISKFDTIRVYNKFPNPTTNSRVSDLLYEHNFGRDRISVLSDPEEGIFVGSMAGKLIRILPNDSILFYDLSIVEPSKILKRRVVNHYTRYDARRKLYYVNDRHFIYQFNLNTKHTRVVGVSGDSSLINDEVVSFEIDPLGNIWVPTASGVVKIFDPQTLRITAEFGDKSALRVGMVLSMVKGPDKKMFLRTYRGIVMFDGDDSSFFLINSAMGLLRNIPQAILFENNKLFASYPDGFQHADLGKITGIQKTVKAYISQFLINESIFRTDSLIQYKRKILLSHNQNNFLLKLSVQEFNFPEHIQFAYRLNNYDEKWNYADHQNRSIKYSKLKPGNYLFEYRARLFNGEFSDPQRLSITISPAWWQTNWSKIVFFLMGSFLLFLLVRWRIKTARKQEQQKLFHEKELLELEAKALRAQMNPHFIFNCLNSIKSLIQEDQKGKSVTYLTTFSKLIRTLLNNADKKEISLYDEIETCKLYLQLEAMRFDSKFSYHVSIDETIDLKSISVPALIIQPFIENAIWHGIVPKGSDGTVSLSVSRDNGNIRIMVDDDGIGRESSYQNKAVASIGHQSRGINLTQSRLELDNLLQQRQAKLETIDKRDDNGKASGTQVIIILPQDD